MGSPRGRLRKASTAILDKYEWRGIAEYWILDPVVGQVKVLGLPHQGYSEAIFAGEAVVESPSFPDWSLTAEAMLTLG